VLINSIKKLTVAVEGGRATVAEALPQLSEEMGKAHQ